MSKERRPTSTSSFGVGRREGHDASTFYERFDPPRLSSSTDVQPVSIDEPFVNGDARHMTALPDSSVALVVTSPPYFVGKEYELELERDGIPRSYLEYLDLLEAVFTECARVLEPGGRIAVNVANLGRKPYRSLASDVIGILQDRLGLLLRGEVVWQKARGASGSCAWGSFRSPTNPVLRDITERVIIASKGRFDRALSVDERSARGLPHASSITSDEFMEATLDVWEIQPESAARIGHPAPFPIGLPERLIQLYTFEDDVVLDPFMGSGTTLAAAARWGRRYVGYDLDPEYVDLARNRVEEELTARARRSAAVATEHQKVAVHERRLDQELDFQARASKEGRAAQDLAVGVLQDAGFTVLDRNVKLRGTGVTVNVEASDALGQTWYFDVSGAFTTTRDGLLRTDTMWKCLGRAAVLRSTFDGAGPDAPRLVLLTTHLPARRSAGDTAMRSVGPDLFFDAIAFLDDEGRDRLRSYATGAHAAPLPGFWSDDDLR